MSERDRTIAYLTGPEYEANKKQADNDLAASLVEKQEEVRKLSKALEEIASEEMMIGSAPVKMKHIAQWH
ncbi:hypothetical protein [Paenibacillus terrae]|uniref:Uncharacterized protein n=1 Tax=Paenibacillus terrae TaxID=159743 RepID=A0A0D7WYY0_9BACL|nr:hypothetical protein [Paenibacillus terrae]KJD44194.1 hypothetical protein QD47_18515 [Paenibacillus terrae]